MKILQIIDYDYFGESYLEIAKKVKDSVDFIWFRIKNVDGRKIFDKANRLAETVDRDKLILSERPDIAMFLGYKGVQLNKNCLPVSAVKEKFPRLVVGYSAHTVEEVSKLNADFFTLSPIFYTPKDFKVEPIGVGFDIPKGKKVFALGGISSDNIEKIINRGFFGVAGIRFYHEVAEIKKRLK